MRTRAPIGSGAALVREALRISRPRRPLLLEDALEPARLLLRARSLALREHTSALKWAVRWGARVEDSTRAKAGNS